MFIVAFVCCLMIMIEGVSSFTLERNPLNIPRISHRQVTKCIQICSHSRLLLSMNNNEGVANGVETVSLDGLGSDHEAVGDRMAKSVAAWLDAEVRKVVMSEHNMNIDCVLNTYMSDYHEIVDAPRNTHQNGHIRQINLHPM